MFGVGLATYGDVYFTMAGFLLSLFGVVLASLKVSHPKLGSSKNCR